MKTSFEKINRWFRIEETEKPWIFALLGGILFVSAANTLSWNLLQALVIKRLGVAWLPPFFIASSFAFSLGGWYAIRFLRRFPGLIQGIDMSMLALPLALVFAVTQQFFVKESGLPVIVGFVALGLVITTSLLYIGLHKLLSASADIFNVEQVQRFEPIIMSAMLLGALLAGSLAATLSPRLNNTAMFMLVPGLLLAAAPFCIRLSQLAKRNSLGAMIMESAPKPTKTLTNGWGLGRVYKDKDLRLFVYLLGAVMALYMVFMRIFSYEFAIATNNRFATENELNAFVGTYTAILSVTTFVFVNTVQRWMFRRFGLTQNLLIPPLIVMAGVLGMFFWPIFPIVIAAVFSREVIIYLQKSSVHFLLSSVSDYQRAQAWSWLNGLPLTLGTLLGSGFLAAVAYLMPDADAQTAIRVVAVFAFEFLLLRLLITWHVKQTYPKVLLHGLKEGDFKTRVRTMEALAEAKHMKNRPLAEILDIIRDPQEPVMLRSAGLKTLSSIGDPSVLRVVGKLFHASDPELRRAAYRTIASFRYTPEQLFDFGFSRQTLLKELRRAYAIETPSEAIEDIFQAMISLRDPDIVSFLQRLMAETTDDIRRNCLHSLRSFQDPGIIDAVRPHLISKNPEIKAMAIKALWQFTWERRLIRPHVDELLQSPPDSKAEFFGFYLIGALKLKEERNRLFGALKQTEGKNRLAAAIALCKLGEEAAFKTLEDALRQGSAHDAYEVARLADHPDVEERERKRIRSLIHLHHLHYPESSPVTEPLRVRLCDIPKDCLRDLRSRYKKPEDALNLAKIENALKNIRRLPETKGRVALLGLDNDWLEMSSVTLLAHGYKVRTIKALADRQPEEILVGFDEAGDLGGDAIILTADPDAQGENRLLRTNYTPSKLLTLLPYANTADQNAKANPFLASSEA